MIAARSIFFYIAFIGWFFIAAILLLPIALLPRRFGWWGVRLWACGSVSLLRWICNVQLEVRGRENLPNKGGFILASKHQSYLETLVFPIFISRPAYILKRELLFIPLFGFYLWRFGQIAVKRSDGANALRHIGKAALPILKQDRAVLIFPQGTRTALDARAPYRSGVQYLARLSHAPVVPVALNSGLFWPPRTFCKYPGTLIVEILPPLTVPPAPRDDFMAALEAAIEPATARLIAEGRSAQRALVPSARTD